MLEQSILLTIGVAFLITVVLSPIFIPFLRRLKFGQSIRDEGPKSHQKKSGTPTMGGIMILLSIIVATLIMVNQYAELTYKTFLLLFVTIGFGLLGFLDDFIKVVLKRNLGLTSKQKFLGQVVISIIFYFIARQFEFSTEVTIPGIKDPIDLGWFYVVFLIIWLVGFSNAVNLTDGIDGLVAGLGTISFSTYALIAWRQDQIDVLIVCLAIIGGLIGFFPYNRKPAKIFMGDVGSLALGGLLAAISILLHQEWTLLLVGLVYVCETASVMLQVASFKLTGKRIFKMSPIHHHFEMSGWSEWKIDTVFWCIALGCSLLTIALVW